MSTISQLLAILAELFGHRRIRGAFVGALLGIIRGIEVIVHMLLQCQLRTKTQTAALDNTLELLGAAVGENMTL